MSKINDITVTPEMQAALLLWLEVMPDRDAVAIADLLPGGFRKPQMIRERLKGLIQGPSALPPWMVGNIALSCPASPAVSALSVATLRKYFDLLAVAMDPPTLLIALAADDRPEVRRLAAEQLAVSSKTVSDVERNAATELWLDVVGSSFIQPAGIPIPPPPVAGEDFPADTGEAEFLAQELDEQDKTLAELRTKLDKERAGRAEDRRRLTAAAKEERDRLAKEIGQLKQQVNVLASQKSSLEKKLQELERQKQEAVKSALKAELASLEREWLAEAVEVESLRSDGSAADLLLRVQEALEAQKTQDRHSGNRLELARRLQDLRAARQQLHDARANAVHPLTSLAGLAEQVEHEIARTESKLGSPRTNDQFAERLLEQINVSPDLNTLHESGTLVDSLCEARLLTGAQTHQVYAALQRRHDILLAQSKRGGHEPFNHWLSFPSLLHHNLDCMLLLDGHNVLFALDQLQPYFDNGKPGLNARKRLIELVQRLIGGRPKAHARIVFDGPEASVETVAENLKVEFSGGTADHRADDAIVRHLTQKSFQDLKWRTFVVTNDRDLQRRIRSHHAYYMPAGAFDLMLRKFNCG